MSFSAVIRYQDVGLIKTGTLIQPIPDASAPDMTKLLALATSLRSYINAGVQGYSLLEWTEAAVTGAVATATGSNCEKGQINYSYVDAGGVTQYGVMWLPNPDPAHFEFVEGVGYRLLAASKTLLETAMSTASGLTVVITEGKREYKERMPGISSKNDSCLRFIDAVGNHEFMSFALATDSAALVAFGEALNEDVFTRSVLDRSFFLAKTDVICDPATSPGLPTTGEWDSVEARAFAKMQYVEGGKKKFMTVILPGIKQTNCELKSGKRGWKLTKAVGVGVALALTSFFGSANRTLRYVGSRVDVKDLQPQ